MEVVSTGMMVGGLHATSESTSMMAGYNAQINKEKTNQIKKSLDDNVEIKKRRIRSNIGNIRANVAKSNILMEGSPMLAEEQALQNGLDDLNAMYAQAGSAIAGLGQETVIGHMQAASAQTQAVFQTGQTAATMYYSAA